MRDTITTRGQLNISTSKLVEKEIYVKRIIKIKFRGNLLPFSCGIFCLLLCYMIVLQDYNFACNLPHVRKVYYREERTQAEAVREAGAYGNI